MPPPDPGPEQADEEYGEDTVTYAVEHGDQRSVLEALRLKIAMHIDDEAIPARDLAALSRRLLEVEREITAIDATDDGDTDEVPEDDDFDPEDL